MKIWLHKRFGIFVQNSFVWRFLKSFIGFSGGCFKIPSLLPACLQQERNQQGTAIMRENPAHSFQEFFFSLELET